MDATMHRLQMAIEDKDLTKVCKILTRILKGATVGDASHWFEELELELSTDDIGWFSNCFTCCDTLILKGTKPKSRDAYARIEDIMSILHYDNGLPLSGINYPAKNPTQYNSYFDHYDRDQDLWGFYWDVEIYNFVTDGEGIYMKVDYSLSDLRADLTACYDGASWDHDFDRAW